MFGYEKSRLDATIYLRCDITGPNASGTAVREEAAARGRPEPATAELCDSVGALHESLAEGAAETVRRTE